MFDGSIAATQIPTPSTTPTSQPTSTQTSTFELSFPATSTSTPFSLPTSNPTSTPTPISCPTPTNSPTPQNPTPTGTPTPGHPAYTPEELNLAARIISQEAGIGQFFRGTDEDVARVSTAVAWTMRNRIEVGEEIEAPNATVYRKEDSYSDTFKYYDPYTQQRMPDSPDSIVLQAVRAVFDATDRTSDPLQGAIFTINRECALQKGSLNPVYIVEWEPLLGGSTQGKYFYSEWPGAC